MPVRWNAKNKNGITSLHEILGRDYGIEEPHWGPSYNIQAVKSVCDASLLLVGTLMSKGDVSGSVTFHSSVVMCVVLTNEIVKYWHYGDDFLFVIIYFFNFFSVSG